MGLLGLAAGYAVGRNSERNRSRRHRRGGTKNHGAAAFRFKRSEDDDAVGDGDDGGNALEAEIGRVFTVASRLDPDQE